ncbi:MAG: hypothetical protein JST09_07060 [Bacteroidetes bacterium]|nr:hypothetical protein [Bacteroidota bacterium]
MKKRAGYFPNFKSFMKKLNFFLTVCIFLVSIAIHAQAQTKQPAKKANKLLIKAHRGTIVTDIKQKVSKTAQLKYTAFPKIGTEIVAVPAGAITVGDSINSYYYKAGIYYVQNKTGYVVTLPVAGIRLKGLPIGYRRVPIGDKIYFYYFGTFYRQVENSDNYETIVPPETAVIDGLPNGYIIKKVDGTEYYFLNNTYYAEIGAPAIEGKIGYEVVTIIEAY